MRLFSTEQVSKYHPDKLADQISDLILTEILKQDKLAQCGIETLIKGSTVVLGGEITANAKINYKKIVKQFMSNMRQPFSKLINLIGRQSKEINSAVVNTTNFGAGDQGMMYGYACRETESMLPYGFDLANKIIKSVESYADRGEYFKGDAKCQVTVDLDKRGIDSLHTVLVSVCQKKDCTLDTAKQVINKILKELYVPINKVKLIVNPSGNWFVGGAKADCGLTGRKIVCDQYGGYCPVGGGAFSGKNPTKVDRSAAYMARYLAKYVLKTVSPKASFCEIQLSYGIGMSEPIGLSVKTDIKDEGEKLVNILLRKFNLTPAGIIKFLDLYNVNYGIIAQGCHYRDEGFSWEIY